MAKKSNIIASNSITGSPQVAQKFVVVVSGHVVSLEFRVTTVSNFNLSCIELRLGQVLTIYICFYRAYICLKCIPIAQILLFDSKIYFSWWMALVSQ